MMPARILVVDDEAVNRELLKAILEDAGYEVALALATAVPPDLILLDLRMPGMSGLEVCEQLKRDPATQAVPVIVVTAHGEVTHKEAALTRGADDFVTKPVDAGDLRARVSAMLKDLLSEHGFCVFAASNGSDALELTRQHPPEAAILDIMMPDMSGLEVLERLHAQDPDLPVIMLTAFPSSQNAIAALKLGAFDFIVKGLDHTLVVLAVHRAVRYRRDILDRQREYERLRARIAELEGALAAR